MRKNDAGLAILEKGDVVRIGKGKVLYSVFAPAMGGGITIQSHNTGKVQTVDLDRVNLVEAVQAVAYAAGCSVEEIQENVGREAGDFGPVPEPEPTSLSGYLAGREPLFSDAEQATIMRDVDGETEKFSKEMAKTHALGSGVVETSAYAKAVLFALNKLGKHVYAGTVRKNVKAKRRGLNARQKASRKANR